MVPLSAFIKKFWILFDSLKPFLNVFEGLNAFRAHGKALRVSPAGTRMTVHRRKPVIQNKEKSSRMSPQTPRTAPILAYKLFIQMQKNDPFFWHMSCDLGAKLASLRSNRIVKPSAPSNPPYQKVYLFCPWIENEFSKRAERRPSKRKIPQKVSYFKIAN